MKLLRDGSWWALAASLLFLWSSARPTRLLDVERVSGAVLSRGDGGLGAGVGTEVGSDGAGLRPAWKRGLLGSHAYTTGLVEVIRTTSDASAARILGLIETNLAPGWEETFVLHDALAVAGALTDLARMISFASSENLEHRPRAALRGEALRVQGIADGVARRWLAGKHPMLGANAIEQILQEPSREVLPLLGHYNLMDEGEAISVLGVPVVGHGAARRPGHR